MLKSKIWEGPMTPEEEEQKFLEACRKVLREEGFRQVRDHPITVGELPRAQPCRAAVDTRYLRYKEQKGNNEPAPIPQYERQ